MENSQRKRLTGAAAIVMSSIVLSRITGFVREMLVPNMLGVNEISDAYNIAFRITGLMYDLLVGGAIAAALIPVLTGYLAKNEEEEGWKAVGTFINIVFLAMSVVCFLGIIFAPQIVPLIAPGLDSEETKQLTIRLIRILFPSVAFLMLAGISNGVLNSYQRFAAAAYGPTIYNLGSALSIFLLHKNVEHIAYGVMFSSFAYFLFQLMHLYRNLKHYKIKLFFGHLGFRRLLKLAVPSLVSSSIVQVNIIISSSFASLFDPGKVTALQMADRTWQLPYGIFAQGIGITILPALSASLAVGDIKDFKNTLMRGLKTVLLLTIPSAVGFVVLKDPIIRTIFKFTDKFKETDVITTGNILMFFSIALLTQSIVTIINRGFYADNDTKTPLYIGSSTIIINILLSIAFYRYTSLSVSGMALSYSIASGLNAIMLLMLLNKRMKGISPGKLVEFLAKVIPASIIMGIVLYLIGFIMPFDPGAKLAQLLFLMFEVSVGIIVYFTVVIIFKVDEAKYMYDLIMGKFKKIQGLGKRHK